MGPYSVDVVYDFLVVLEIDWDLSGPIVVNESYGRTIFHLDVESNCAQRQCPFAVSFHPDELAFQGLLEF